MVLNYGSFDVMDLVQYIEKLQKELYTFDRILLVAMVVITT